LWIKFAQILLKLLLRFFELGLMEQ